MAHTHHLLDQAFEAIQQDVGSIPEPRTSLATRVVSGTPGHDSPRDIEPTDDVVVATLQTITRAYQERQPHLLGFLRGAKDRLCVVFDEAHHAPAPSYRKLLKALKADHAEMILLGLTATPTNSDERKAGWLKDLFPQGIIHQSKAGDLLADKILARPHFEKIPTTFEPDFDDREYLKWVDTYRDLPEDIIKSLAESRERNALIADQYVKNRERYGKTIIFAERWFQCEQIANFLKRDGVRADSIYSKVDASLPTPEARNARTADENRLVMERYKNGELDVLLNVKMLTEGTDVPLTQTVFLSRQTTSTILLTQMVGRALRGPRAGGTENAYIVSFEDSWKQKINWAGFEQLVERPFVDDATVLGKRPPVDMISIDLVRRLADQMDSGVNFAPTAFLSLMPVGWYRSEFQAVVEGTEDVETVRHLVMVFEGQEDGYRQFLANLAEVDLSPLNSEFATPTLAEPILAGAIERFFPDQDDEISRVDAKNLFHLARHLAQNEGESPRFFLFEERGGHDLDAVAKDYIDRDLGPRLIDGTLRVEFDRKDRYWKTLYPRYELFKTQYDACSNRLLRSVDPSLAADLGPDAAHVEIQAVDRPSDSPPTSELAEGHEPSNEVKNRVKSRDGFRCLCCGERDKRNLQVDHIEPWYSGGSHSLDNLQTLCRTCNDQKGIGGGNFRVHCARTLSAPSKFPPLLMPRGNMIGDREHWAQSLRRAVNFFYGAAAVDQIDFSSAGKSFQGWTIRLFGDNKPEWLLPYLSQTLEIIRFGAPKAGFQEPEGIRAIGPGGMESSDLSSDP